MTAEIGQLDYLRELAGRLQAARHGEKSALVTQAAQFLRCSPQKVWTLLKEKLGYSKPRKPRADKGSTKVPEEIARKAAGMLHVATRANGRRTLKLADSLAILTANGHGVVDTETGEVIPVAASPSTLARAMRRYNCHPELLARPTPCVQMQSKHPNHVWQVDASVCVLFYLPRGGMKLIDEKEVYKNKPQNQQRIERERVIRYVIVDHFSGAFYLEYVHGAESAANLTQIFLNAIQHRGAQDPLHGVPLILLQDRGSANEAHLFRNLLERLQVEVITHLPGNPRAKGSVEKTHHIVERNFEGRLPFMQVADLAHLNELAAVWRLAFNAQEIHSRHGRPRNAMWLVIREEQLRKAPPRELCQELVTTRPVEVTVRTNLTVGHSIKGYGPNDYDVRHLPGVGVKVKLTVVVNPYRAPAIDVLLRDEQGREIAYTVEPLQKTLAGFAADAPVFGEQFRDQADTAVDTARKEIRKEAYGVETELELAAKRKARTPAYEGINPFADVEQTAVPDYLPKRGRELGLEARQREVAKYNIVEAAKILKPRLGERWTADSLQWLAQRFPDGVPQDQIDTIEAQLRGIGKAAPLRVVGGANAEA